MQVNVIAIDETSATFETPLGTFTTRIPSKSHLHLGACTIELSIDVPLELDVNASHTEQRVAWIANEGAHLDEDGVAYLRLARDALVMIELEGSLPAGTWVKWKVRENLVRAWGS
jgi:hypothetical protein